MYKKLNPTKDSFLPCWLLVFRNSYTHKQYIKSHWGCEKKRLNVRQLVSEECTEEKDLNGENYSQEVAEVELILK